MSEANRTRGFNVFPWAASACLLVFAAGVIVGHYSRDEVLASFAVQLDGEGHDGTPASQRFVCELGGAQEVLPLAQTNVEIVKQITIESKDGHGRSYTIKVW